MRQFHVGDLVVTKQVEDKIMPISILTDRDIVIEVLAKDINPASVSVKDIMSQELFTADEKSSVSEMIERMLDGGVRRLPIVDSDGALVGIVTIDDLIDRIAKQLSGITSVLSKGRQYEKSVRS